MKKLTIFALTPLLCFSSAYTMQAGLFSTIKRAGFFLAGISTGLYVNKLKKPQANEYKNAIDFDRETMSTHDYLNGWKIEGYWASSANPEKDIYHGQYPFPQAHPEPFSGQDEFLRKLKNIEKIALDAYMKKITSDEKDEILQKMERNGITVKVIGYRGLSPSRFEEGVNVGSQEFEDHQYKICWPEGFRSYYVERFNVKPSREFYEYVMNKKN